MRNSRRCTCCGRSGSFLFRQVSTNVSLFNASSPITKTCSLSFLSRRSEATVLPTLFPSGEASECRLEGGALIHRLIGLPPVLTRDAPPATVFDKAVYSRSATHSSSAGPPPRESGKEGRRQRRGSVKSKRFRSASPRPCSQTA
jgi:hypothetical protein